MSNSRRYSLCLVHAKSILRWICKKWGRTVMFVLATYGIKYIMLLQSLCSLCPDEVHRNQFLLKSQVPSSETLLLPSRGEVSQAWEKGIHSQRWNFDSGSVAVVTDCVKLQRLWFNQLSVSSLKCFRYFSPILSALLPSVALCRKKREPSWTVVDVPVESCRVGTSWSLLVCYLLPFPCSLDLIALIHFLSST